MIKELIVLADELDKCDEKQAADIVDKLVKFAIEEELDTLPPLVPEADMVEEFEGEPTKVEFVSKTGKELVSRLKHFFMQNPDPMSWSDADRAKVIEAMEVLKG